MTVALERFANDFATTLSAGALSTDATISVAAAAPTSLQGAGQFRIKVDDEIMVVTSGAATTTWSVSRGAEGTTAAAHSSGAAVTHVLTQGALERWMPDYAWQPRHAGLLAANFDTAAISSGAGLASGQLVAVKVFVPETVTFANVHMYLTAAGASLTAGQNFAGVYTSGGTLVGLTADATTAWASTGFKTLALSAASGQSLTVPGGPGVYVYVGFLANGTTAPQLLRLALNGVAVRDAGLASGYRQVSGGTGLTSLPTSPTFVQSTFLTLYWGGLS